MSEPNHNKPKVTLEDLLRLKRHERPPTEYWLRFDRELNERVWRTLAGPGESRGGVGGVVSVVLGRPARWLAMGAVSALALTMVWLGSGSTPPTFAQVGGKAQPVLAASATLPVAASADQTPVNNAQSLATFAQNNLPAIAQPALVAAKVLDSSNLAGFHKVPAMLTFATTEAEGARYPNDALSTPAFSTRIRGSAY
jgi:hypothetical protein